jgi:hypothetical protein
MESELLENKGPGLILPMVWHKRLDGLTGKTQTVARYVLRQLWDNRGHPVKVDNSPLLAIGVGRHAKRGALEELERLGLLDVERPSGQAPIVRIPSHWTTTRKVYGVPWSVIRKEYDWRK